MNKIRLELDSLKVQSFVTAPAEGERGTVQGAESVVVGPINQTKPPQCHVETGNCLGTRFDPGCDTSFCYTTDCPINTLRCLTQPPAC